jgi:predicted DNA-binding transcriptional regulator YafY
MRDALERLCPGFEVANIGERPIRYRIARRPGDLMALSTIGAADLTALRFAAKLLKQSNVSDHAASIERIGAILAGLLPKGQKNRIEPDLEALTEAEGIALRAGPRVDIKPERMRLIRDAILAPYRLKITYQARGTGLVSYHRIEPYALVFGHRPYLLARSVGQKHLSYWALTNIAEIAPLDESFTKPKSFSLKKYLERSFGVFQEKPFNVVWRFDKEVADEAAQFIFHPTQKLIRLPDGRLEVRFTAGGSKEMEWHLATWGGKVEVVKFLNPSTGSTPRRAAP